ncbi:hypothetical protein BH11CYA1_BH11CYA1_45430 [soil metagenome]
MKNKINRAEERRDTVVPPPLPVAKRSTYRLESEETI